MVMPFEGAPRRYGGLSALSACSATNPTQLAWPEAVERDQDGGYEGSEMNHPVGRGADKHNTQREGRKMLLEGEVLVHRDEGVELAAHTVKELAVPDAFPT